ncbi:hypothetical protein CN157_12335 [Sinorhizobium meliloti]|nr:hypothetical protein CDO31_19650 [Sinorhizobium meliloti]ASQ01834.1 hypothetical protein CDO24_31450 [Sinorhizobium meliloti]ASQ06515.1 hypothetical protein CDO23_21640 [Sinorhizobium meliloti]ASQ06550.1 hypothetical protein CDO23_21935 [Sinorhizobium meliloti]ASQ06589.1 hypothetical protein CDO23_22205 [Sinorhizobium meliloti]
MVTPAAWHDFCKITQWCPCCAHSFVPNNRTSLNNKGSKMAALRQIAFDGKGDIRKSTISKMHSP